MVYRFDSGPGHQFRIRHESIHEKPLHVQGLFISTSFIYSSVVSFDVQLSGCMGRISIPVSDFPPLHKPDLFDITSLIRLYL